MKTFNDALHYRRSAKHFIENKKIPHDQLLEILEAGRLAPSSYGFEPWHFLVIESVTIREKLVEAFFYQPQIMSASHLIIILSARPHLLTQHSDYLRNAIRRKLGYNEYGIDQLSHQFIQHLENNARENPDDWAQMQCYIASTQMMLAAAAQEVDSCALGGFKYHQLEQLLKTHVPAYPHQNYAVSHALALGYRRDQPSEQIRWSLDQITTFI